MSAGAQNGWKALVTGFDPFGGDAVNPSYEAVRLLPRRLGTLEVVTAQLPTSFVRGVRELRKLIAHERPVIVLCVGLAADRPAVSVERVAVNLCHARIADNDGRRPQNQPVAARAPVAYFATLPVSKIVAALTRAGIAAELSMSAGTFVCNHVFFDLMHRAARSRGKTRIRRAGFVHVPALPADDALRTLANFTRALTIALRVTQRDLRRAG